jgi:hypothetical protein
MAPPSGTPSLGKDAAFLVEHARAVRGLGPIDAHEDHDALLPAAAELGGGYAAS